MRAGTRAIPIAVIAAASLAWTASTGATEEDCNNAKANIEHLKHEKKSTDERIAKGVFSIMPIGIALNVAKAATQGNKEIKATEYNRQLDKRIAEIKKACRIN